MKKKLGWRCKAKDQLIHTAILNSSYDSGLFVVSVTKGINSLEIIKHSESKIQTKACVVRLGVTCTCICDNNGF